MINSHTKGKSNERKAAKMFSEWSGISLTRVPRSGGLRWKRTADVVGDLICSDTGIDFPYVVEVKARKTLCLSRGMGSKNKLHTFYEQALADSQRSGKLPILFATENGFGGFYLVVNDLHFKVDKFPEPLYTSPTKTGGTLYLYDSKEFFSSISYKRFVKCSLPLTK